MVAIPTFVGVEASTANAVESPAVSSFVGTYQMHQTLGGMLFVGPMQVNADGTAVDQYGQVGQWTSTGKAFRMTYQNSHIIEQFDGLHSRKGISSKKNPGTIMTTTLGNGTWYAVRTA